ncbi:hypothetical protein [Acidovorax sp. PRC11]|uniref:hypothetical protein n=1 Tax=Acidovorax sp. PRC11 TaxID=2962592 RepID=UPI0028823687|nr:hypothetical protein [Acidovorax sp. PRC11]MDT0137748.1 hypothetical protein [Acidovorax sp. PRC11]
MSQDLTRRAIASYLRKTGNQQPACLLSGPSTARGLDYIVLSNLGGILAVVRVLPHSGALKRLKRWPKDVE